MLLKCYTLKYQQIEKTHQCPQDQKLSVFIPISKKGNIKECSNYCTTEPISHVNKVMFKILQARLQQQVNRELLYVQAGFRKARGIIGQIVNIPWITEKTRELQENIYSASLTVLKPLTVWITTNWKILKEMAIPDHLTCLLYGETYMQRNVMQVRKQQLEMDMKQQTGSKLGKQYVKAVMTPCIVTLLI